MSLSNTFYPLLSTGSIHPNMTESLLPYIQKLHVLVHIYVCASEALGCVIEQYILSSA